MKHHIKFFFYILLLSAISYCNAQINPGGIPCEVWTRADMQVYTNAGTTLATNGQTVQQWNDQAPAVVQNMVSSANTPTYYDAPGNFLNFNPQIYFNAGSDANADVMGTTGTVCENFAAQTIFLVHVPTSIGAINTIAGFGPAMEKPGWYFNGGTIELWSYGTWPNVPVNGLAANRAFILGACYTGTTTNINTLNQRNNGQSLYNESTTLGNGVPANDEQFYIGSDANWTNNGGTFSEVIIFSSALSQAQMQLVDSYLAIKYGITLSGVATNTLVTDGNYLLANGTVVWHYPGYAYYQNEVAGIARDDASGLYQKVSNSVFNTNGNALVISLDNDYVSGNAAATRTTTLQNQQALMFGNDLKSTTATQTTNLPTAIYVSRTQRQWKVENTGCVGAVDLYFPTLPALTAGEFYVGLSAPDSNFAAYSIPVGSSATNTMTAVTIPCSRTPANDSLTFFTIAIAKLITEFSTAASNDSRCLGGNLPRLLVKGPVSGNGTNVVITNLGTGTAIAGTDFTLPAPDTIHIPPGVYDGTIATSLPIPLSIINTCWQEPNKTINLSIGATTGYIASGDANGDGTNTNTTTYTMINCVLTPTATIAGTTTLCQNSAAPTITFEAHNGTPPYVFSYAINGAATQTISTTATDSIITLTAPTTTAGTYTYSLLSVSDPTTSTCVPTFTTSAVVTVIALPAATIAGTTTTCFNAADPLITFTGVGTPPYAFTYNINGAATQTVSTTGANSTVTVTAPTTTVGTFTYSLTSVTSTICTTPETGSASVLVNPLPTATIVGTTTVCLGAPSPAITFTGANATPPYTFTYSLNGGANQTVTTTGANTTVAVTAPTTAAGTFTYSLISVASVTGCTQAQTGSAVLLVNPLPTATIASSATVCLNSTSPDITFTGAGSTAPYTFTYTLNGGADQTITTTGANATVSIAAPTTAAGTSTYSLISVAGATGCNQLQTGGAVVVVNPLPTASITGTVTKCLNDLDPVITFTGASTTAPYTFTYSINGGANQTVSTTGANITVTVLAPTNVAGAYTYSLISVTDGTAQGCSQAQRGSAVVTVNPLGATIAGTTSVCQNAAAPTVTFSGTGGTAPYTFTYNINGGGNQTLSTTGANTTVSVTAPTATTGNFAYELSSVQDASAISCLSAASATVTINVLPMATIAGTTTVCFNSSSPDIIFTGATTTPPYTFTYNINGGANQTVSSTGSNTTVTVAAPTTVIGVYTYSLISVQDGTAQACAQPQTGGAVVTVRQPSTATVTASTARVCQNSASPDMVFNGSIGQPPYIFYYSTNVPVGGVTTNSVSSAPGSSVSVTVPTSTPDTIIYTITNVQDASGIICGVGGSIDSVIIDPLPFSTITAALNDVCLGDPAQTITFTGFGVPAPVTFDYSTAVNGGPATAQTPITSIAPSLTATISAPATALGTTIYTNGISSSNVCTGNGNGSARLTVNPIPTGTITLTGPATICQSFTSQVTFTGSVGTPPFTFSYNINGGATQTISTASGQSSVNLTVNQPAGSYTYSLLSVSDTFNCNQAQNGSAVININPLGGTIGASTIVCQNSVDPAVVFTGGGGTAPYTFTYSINGGANQTLSTTGANNTVSVAAPSAATGNFVYALNSVEDATTLSCLSASSSTVTVNALPTATIAGTTTVCQNATQPTITFTGGNTTAPYTFTYSLNGVTQPAVISVGNSATVTEPTATPGPYTYSLISVQDASSATCSQAQAGSAVVTVNQLPTATIAGTTTVCQGAPAPTITFTGANTTAPYTFTYSLNGVTQPVITSIGNVATLTEPTATPGPYSYSLISVQDATAQTCSQAQAGGALITVNQLPTGTIAGTITVCQGTPAPTVTFTGANTTAPYTFTYSINGVTQPGVTSVGNSATVTEPTATPGPYTYSLISVQDASSAACSQAQTGGAIITVNTLPTATIAGTITVCQGVPAPTVTFTGANTTAPYSFTYSLNGVTQPVITSATGSNSATLTESTATPGPYTYSLISVQDASSATCSQAQTGGAIVTVNALPTATIAGTITVCQGSPAPTITFTGAGTTAPYTFTYNLNGGGNQTVATTAGSNSATLTEPTTTPGSYTYLLINVQDASSATCSQAQAGGAVVTVSQLPTATIAGTTTVCQNAAAPTITFTGASTTAPYTFTYSINGGGNQTVATTPGSTTATITEPTTTPGTYTYSLISVMDASSAACSQAQPDGAVITVNALPTASIVGSVVVCQHDPNPTITFTGAGTTSPYTFTYSLNGVTQQLISSAAGSATATLTVPTTTGNMFNFNLLGVQDGSSAACSNVVNSQTANVTVNELPGGGINSSATVCQNDPMPVISFTGTNGGVMAYTFFYTINSGASLNLQSTNGSIGTVNAPTTTAGSYLYQLDSVEYTSGKTCAAKTPNQTITVLVNPLPKATLIGGAQVCVNAPLPNITFTGMAGTAPYIFTFTTNNANSSALQSAANGIISYPSATNNTGTFTYSLTGVQDANGCSSPVQNQIATVIVSENPVAIFTVSPESPSILQPTVTVTNNSTATSWMWNFGDGNVSALQNPGEHTYPDTANTYIIKLIVANGDCIDSSFQTVIVQMPILLYIPNTFTPNGDGLNDIFMPKGEGISNYSMNIYDRWGNMVFYSDDISKGWDGRANGGTNIAQIDTYVYVINATALSNQQTYIYRGVFNLMR